MENKLRKLLILASGKGTRMEAITRGQSKEMLSLKGKTLISLAIEEALSANFSDICVIISKEKDDLHKFLKEEKKKGLPISILVEDKAVNLCTSIIFAEDFLSGEDFGMIFPDMLVLGKDSGIKQLISVYKNYKKPIIGLVKPEKLMGSTWYFNGEKISDILFRVKSLTRENLSGLRFFPRYILPGNSISILKSLKKQDSEVPLLEYFIKESELIGVLLEGKPLDLGIPEGYLEAKSFSDE